MANNSILAIIFIILFNIFFVISEISILTSTKYKLQKLASTGNIGALKALELIEKPELFLSTVQTGITLMSLLLGFSSSSSISIYITEVFSSVSFLSEYSDLIGCVLSLLLIAYINIVSEIVPKRIAMIYPEKFAVMISRGMSLIMILLYPFVIICTNSIKFLINIINIKAVDKSKIEKEEIRFFLNQAEMSGAVDKTEISIMKKLVNMSEIKVFTIMTPRKDIMGIDINSSIEVNINKIFRNIFTYFPVFANNDILGIIDTKKVISDKEITKDKILKNLMEVFYIPENTRITKLIEFFRDKKTKIALVLNEYGELEGLVTFNDILKIFIGNLATDINSVSPNIIKNKNDSYTVRGNTLVKEIMEALNLYSLDSDEEQEYKTLASFMLKRFNIIPKTGQYFNAYGWTFKIIKMNKFRIEKVLISKLK